MLPGAMGFLFIGGLAFLFGGSLGSVVEFFDGGLGLLRGFSGESGFSLSGTWVCRETCGLVGYRTPATIRNRTVEANDGFSFIFRNYVDFNLRFNFFKFWFETWIW